MPTLIGMPLLALMFTLGAPDRGAAMPADSRTDTATAADTQNPSADTADDVTDDVTRDSIAGTAASARGLRGHHAAHRTPAQVIDAKVRRLAKGLGLSQGQQAQLREILVDQYAQLTRLRSESAPGTDRAGAMRAIVDRTRERIQQMLNDEQKKQYAADVPREVTAATSVDLNHWLEVRDAKRRDDAGGSK